MIDNIEKLDKKDKKEKKIVGSKQNSKKTDMKDFKRSMDKTVKSATRLNNSAAASRANLVNKNRRPPTRMYVGSNSGTASATTVNINVDSPHRVQEKKILKEISVSEPTILKNDDIPDNVLRNNGKEWGKRVQDEKTNHLSNISSLSRKDNEEDNMSSSIKPDLPPFKPLTVASENDLIDSTPPPLPVKPSSFSDGRSNSMVSSINVINTDNEQEPTPGPPPPLPDRTPSKGLTEGSCNGDELRLSDELFTTREGYESIDQKPVLPDKTFSENSDNKSGSENPPPLPEKPKSLISQTEILSQNQSPALPHKPPSIGSEIEPSISNQSSIQSRPSSCFKKQEVEEPPPELPLKPSSLVSNSHSLQEELPMSTNSNLPSSLQEKVDSKIQSRNDPHSEIIENSPTKSLEQLHCSGDESSGLRNPLSPPPLSSNETSISSGFEKDQTSATKSVNTSNHDISSRLPDEIPSKKIFKKSKSEMKRSVEKDPKSKKIKINSSGHESPQKGVFNFKWKKEDVSKQDNDISKDLTSSPSESEKKPEIKPKKGKSQDLGRRPWIKKMPRAFSISIDKKNNTLEGESTPSDSANHEDCLEGPARSSLQQKSKEDLTLDSFHRPGTSDCAFLQDNPSDQKEKNEKNTESLINEEKNKPKS